MRFVFKLSSNISTKITIFIIVNIVSSIFALSQPSVSAPERILVVRLLPNVKDETVDYITNNTKTVKTTISVW